jgi:coenzyme F420-reducing hydrogenase delta subunit
MTENNKKEEFDPQIIAFLCNWCSYAGADLAGTSRIQYPTNIRVIRVLCSGRVDPSMILQAFSLGADGVMVLGCHFGDCHYISGNYYAEKKVKFTQQFLKMLNINPERLALDWVSAAEGLRFAKLVANFTKEIKKLGSLRSDGINREKLDKNLEAALKTVESDEVRWIVGKWHDLLEEPNVYGEKLEPQNLEKMILDVALRRLRKESILAHLHEKGYDAKAIADSMGLPTREILFLLTDLLAEGKIKMQIKDSFVPVFVKTLEL